MLLGLLTLFIGQLFANTVVPIGTKIASPFTGAFLFVFLRFFVATILLFLLTLFSEKKKIPFSAYKEFAFLGFLLAINVLFFTLGIAHTTVIMSTLIYSITPILVGIAGHFLLKETMNKYKIIGLVVSFLGLLLLVHQSFSHYHQNAFGEPLGNILIFIAMLGYSYYVFQSRKILHTKNYHPLRTTFLTFIFTTICTGILLLFALSTGNTSLKPLPNEGIIGFLLVGIGSVAQYLFLQIGVKRTNAFTASLFQYVAPFIAAAVTIPLLHEQVTQALLIGGIMILAGVFIATTYEDIQKRIHLPTRLFT
jgi:drug/metabolite transporter (DMT)-like permease